MKEYKSILLWPEKHIAHGANRTPIYPQELNDFLHRAHLAYTCSLSPGSDWKDALLDEDVDNETAYNRSEQADEVLDELSDGLDSGTTTTTTSSSSSSTTQIIVSILQKFLQCYLNAFGKDYERSMKRVRKNALDNRRMQAFRMLIGQRGVKTLHKEALGVLSSK